MSYPRKGKADYYALGEHNVACFQCGRKFKSSQMFKHWQGYLVCRDHWEPRHPQDFVKAVREDIAVPNAQPPADTFINVCTPCTASAYAGLGTAGCMTVGAEWSQTQLDAFNCGLTLPAIESCYLEDYANGIAAFSGDTSSGYFTFAASGFAGQLIQTPRLFSSFAEIYKSVPLRRLTHLSFYVWRGVTEVSDVVCWLQLLHKIAGTAEEIENKFFFKPRDYDGSDALNRPILGVPGSGNVRLGTTALAQNTWYLVEVFFADGTNACVANIYNPDFVTLRSTNNFTRTTGRDEVGIELYGLDGSSGDNTIPTKYVGLEICGDLL